MARFDRNDTHNVAVVNGNKAVSLRTVDVDDRDDWTCCVASRTLESHTQNHYHYIIKILEIKEAITFGFSTALSASQQPDKLEDKTVKITVSSSDCDTGDDILVGINFETGKVYAKINDIDEEDDEFAWEYFEDTWDTKDTPWRFYVSFERKRDAVQLEYFKDHDAGWKKSLQSKKKDTKYSNEGNNYYDDGDDEKDTNQGSSIETFLEELGLHDVYFMFEDNGYSSLNEIADITDDDLRDLGVNRQFDRKKILNAVKSHFYQ